MTNPQIYGLFAMLTAAAFAGIVFYCVGLRAGRAAGYEQGRSGMQSYRHQIIDNLRNLLTDSRAQLHALKADGQKLREEGQMLQAQLDSHISQQRPAVANLDEADLALLQAVANKLDLSADTFAGLNAHDHARASRQLQAQVLDMTDRLKIAQANTQPPPDSELIDWLEAEASVAFDFENCTLTFASNYANELGIESVRALLAQAKADSEGIVDSLGDLATPAQEDAA